MKARPVFLPSTVGVAAELTSKPVLPVYRQLLPTYPDSVLHHLPVMSLVLMDTPRLSEKSSRNSIGRQSLLAIRLGDG